MNPLAMLKSTFCDFQDFPKVRVAKNPIFKILRKFPGKMGNFSGKMGNFSGKWEISRENGKFPGKFPIFMGNFLRKSYF